MDSNIKAHTSNNDIFVGAFEIMACSVIFVITLAYQWGNICDRSQQLGRDISPTGKLTGRRTIYLMVLQVTTYIGATAVAEMTGLTDQNPLTTQFYLLLAESPL